MCVFRQAAWTHSVEEHAVPDAGLDILRSGVTRVFPQEAPCSGLASVRVQAAELRFWRPAVLHATVTRQDTTAKRVDHVLLRVHAHLQGEQGAENKRQGKQEVWDTRKRISNEQL